MAPGALKSKRFCVTIFAASSSMVDESYKESARTVGRRIAEAGWVQCNGGGKYGLMAAATDGGLESSGVVDCVILDKFVGANMHDGPFGEVQVSKSLTERKAGLAEKADAFLCLPGGLGTLEEVAEVMSWLQLSVHSKPIVFLNTNGFYDALWTFYQRAVSESFVSKACNNAILITADPEEAIEIIRRYKPVSIDKASIHAGNMNADWTTSAGPRLNKSK